MKYYATVNKIIMNSVVTKHIETRKIMHKQIKADIVFMNF